MRFAHHLVDDVGASPVPLSPAGMTVHVTAAASRQLASAADWAAWRWRVLLAVGALACMAMAAALGRPEAMLQADPELARLLRGMALIKAIIVLGVAALLWWRFAAPLPRGDAVACVVATALAAGASMLIWQLTWLPAAAMVFHAGGATLLWMAWREHRRGG